MRKVYPQHIRPTYIYSQVDTATVYSFIGWFLTNVGDDQASLMPPSQDEISTWASLSYRQM
jgi:hypothetical protein